METNISKEQNIITGVGVVSCFGNSPNDFWRGITSYKSAEDNISLFSVKGADQSIRGAEIKKMDLTGYNPQERMLSMGKKAIKSAIQDWGGDTSKKRIGLVFGSGLGLADQFLKENENTEKPNILSSINQAISDHFKFFTECIYIGSACSAGAQAIAYGKDLLDSGYFDLVIAGGIEVLSQIAYAGFLRLNALDSSSCHPFDKNRKGIMVGEGAAFIAMERFWPDMEKHRKMYCLLAGAGVTNDAHNVVQLEPNGIQIKRAIKMAINEASLLNTDIDLVIAHGTGTPINDKTEAEIIAETFSDHLKNLLITAPKGAIGHTGGASGVFGLIVAIYSILNGKVPSIVGLNDADNKNELFLVQNKNVSADIKAVLINTFAFGGVNVVLIAKKCNSEK